ncbi:hypothetical protein BDW59DRAFT_162998 [Aspergillus cavernicola]|uniref:Uncharacterized protein n=1 Tax=Aspergillus cavernicola TaxID=176166 RepID=A0ABR4I7V9_9EURO
MPLQISRPFSLTIPARQANTIRLTPKPRGFLADKGPFPYTPWTRSYEDIFLRGSESREIDTLMSETVEQERRIEGLERRVSDLVGGRVESGV